jgi:O-acetyl-ADP-ribose deacetylase (regulator of RNase III)
MSQIFREHKFPTGQILQLVQGDLTKEQTDAIVNAANSHLQHGGGVAGAIARAGGPQIQAESNAWVRQHGPVAHDHPAYTSAGNLPCQTVIHAVGPIWGEGDEDAKLAAAVKGSLELADQLKLASIAIPAISTGIYGFPKDRAAGVILLTIHKYFTSNPASSVNLVRLTLIDQPTLQAFLQAWEAHKPADHKPS